MALEEVSLPKTYKNGKILFEKDLDNFRLAAEEAFANIQLNFTQLAKDIFSVGYEYGNNGGQIKFPSIEDRLAQFEGGGAEIAGTASDTFTINTDGNSATLDTALLTGNHTYLFPDVDGTFMLTDAVQDVTGAKTFTSLALKILATGGGTGVTSLLYANVNNDRSYTIPDVNADASFVMTEGAQIISGIKRFLNTIEANNSTAINLMALNNRIIFDEDDDTYIRANIDDQLVFSTNNVDRVFFSNTAALFNVTIACGTTNAIDLITLGNKIILDADDDTSLRCTVDDNVVFEIGGTDRVSIGSTGTVSIDAAIAIDLVTLGNRIDLDADNDTSIRCSVDDRIDFEIAGSDTIAMTAQGILLPTIDPPTNNALNVNSAVRCYGFVAGVAGTGDGYNTLSFTKNGTGDYTVTIDRDFDAAFPRALTFGLADLSDGIMQGQSTGVVGSARFLTFSSPFVAADRNFTFAVHGLLS